jgi:hypothetical protein
MAVRKPLVLDDNADLQQLQSQDEIPLAVRVAELEQRIARLEQSLDLNGIDRLPED